MAKEEIKHYSVTRDSDVFAISLVEDPAIEINYIALAKEKPLQLLLENEDKHLLIGCVLVPNKPIYRRTEDGEEFYIQFDEKTVEYLAHNYLKNHRLENFTTDHLQEEDGICVVESWVKMSENDKSVEYGIDCPIGSWLIATKVDNDEVWQRIKGGELKGFSVEAFVNLEELNLNKTYMNKENLESVEITPTFWDKLKAIIAEALGKPQEEQPTAEEVVEEIVEEVVVEEEPIEMQDEQPTEETKVDEIVEEVVATVEETVETPNEEVKELEAIIDQLKEEIATKDAEIDELKKTNQKLSRQPSAKPIQMSVTKQANPREVIEQLKNGTYFK